jgi:hypothetical protein
MQPAGGVSVDFGGRGRGRAAPPAERLMVWRVVIAAILSCACAACAQPCHNYWSGMGPGTCATSVYATIALRTFDDGSGMALYALTCEDVRRWSGSGWQSLPIGAFPTRPTGMAVFDEGNGEALYVFARTGNDHVLLRWTGAGWTAATPGLYVNQIAVGGSYFAPRLSVVENGNPVIYGVGSTGWDVHPTRWNGSSWSFIGTANGGSIRALAFDDGTGSALHWIGFSIINGIPTGGLAKWVGGQWIPLLSPSDRIGFVRGLAAGQIGGTNALYIMADRSINGVLQEESVRRWDGAMLTDIGIPNWYRLPHNVFSFSDLHTFDDGSGPSLYLGGAFSYHALEIPRRGNIGRWDGTQWHRVGVGLNGDVRHIASMKLGQTPMLFAAGLVHTIGEGSVPGIAKWVGCPQCYANCDSSRTAPAVNVEDFTCFINRFAQRDPYADCNVDGWLNVDDFNCFIGRFVEAMTGGPGVACP